ncbi:PAS domain-containing sensor histidine kinase [Leptolyngbya sp. AN02str]|uniref:PAS domain-containing sensor histidine kinase n=1 Tax=Leptolyngbya sp. AN02str TaxID=3423363 RepID=UPI003D31F660
MMSNSATDVTLRERNALLNSILESTTDIVFVKDREGRYILVNSKLERWLNRPRSEILGKTDKDLLPEYASNIQQRDRLIWTSGIAETYEEQMKQGDQEFFLSTTKAPWLDAHGNVLGVVGITRDISDRKRDEMERKQAQQALEASEERFRLVAEQTGQLIYDYDISAGTITWAGAIETITGYSKEEFQRIGIHQWETSIHPRDRPTALAALDRAMQRIERYRVEYRFQKADGSYLYVEDRGVFLPDETGKPRRMVGTMTDVSDRIATEQTLRQQESLYRVVFESVNDGLCITDIQTGQLIAFNPSFAKMHGYSVEEMQQLTPPDFLHPDSLSLFQQFVEVTGQKKEFSCQSKQYHKSGALIDVEVSGVPCMLNNKPHGLAVVRDVSDRKRVEEERNQAEAALRKSEERFQVFMDNSPTATWIIDGDGNLLYVNKTYYTMFQLPSIDLVGKNLIELYPEEAVAEFVQVNRTVLQQQKTMTTIEPLPLSDGTMGDTLVYKFPMQDVSGQSVVGGIAIDITDRRRAELALQESEATLRQQTEALEQTLQELQHTQAQLVQTEKMSSLGQLVAGVAHEINNPVNFIYGNLTHADSYIQDLMNLLDLYQQHYPRPHPELSQAAEEIDLEFLVEDLPKLLASMKLGAERIQKIVLALRNFSRMDEAEVKAVNLHEGIDSTLMILHNRLKDRPNRPAINVVKDYAVLPNVLCYAGQLNQVFMNLIANAIDALDERDEERSLDEIQHHPSEITITTQLVKPNHVQIRIADNGPGIPEAAKRRLFEPFFTTKPVGKGTGLGLSISYQVVVEKHGGSLKCNSALGQGAEFLIEIPLRSQDEA